MQTDPDGLALGHVPTNLQGIGMVSYGSDDALGVEFFTKTIYLPELKMGETGVQVDRLAGEEKRTYLSIRFPATSKIQDGDCWVGEATEEHKQRFWRHWQAFQQGGGAYGGTELKLMKHAALDEALIAEFKRNGVTSIEQLAAQPDNSMPRLGQFGYALRKAAQGWQQDQKELVHLKDLKEDQETLKATAAAQAAQIAQLTALLEAQTAPATDAAKQKGK